MTTAHNQHEHRGKSGAYICASSYGDCYDRYTVRIEEMRQSMRIIEQAIKTMPSDGPYRSKLKPVVKIAEGHVYSNI